MIRTVFLAKDLHIFYLYDAFSFAFVSIFPLPWFSLLHFLLLTRNRVDTVTTAHSHGHQQV